MARTPEAALRQILAELIDRLENTVTWARLALTLSEREGQPEGGRREP